METEKIDVPKFEGFECIGFVVPCDHLPCSVLGIDEDGDLALDHEANSNYDIASVCYRKIKPKQITFEFTGEVRPPLKNELARTINGIFFFADFDHKTASYEIWKVVEE